MAEQRDKLTWEEAEGVVRLHRRQVGMNGSVPISAVARSLNIDEAQAQALLERYRAEQPARRAPFFVDRSGVISAVLAAAAIFIFAVFFIAGRRATGQAVVSKLTSADLLTKKPSPERTTVFLVSPTPTVHEIPAPPHPRHPNPL